MYMQKPFQVSRYCYRPQANIEILVCSWKMDGYRKEMWFNITKRRELINITRDVQECLFESGIREGLSDILKNTEVSRGLSTTGIGKALLSRNVDQDSAGNDLSALDDTVQESVEEGLNESLDKLCLYF